MLPMRYPEAIQFLYGLQLFGASFGLERVRRLAELAGNPHERLRFIHVAGTNGKGSVCAMLESIYRAAGLRTGLFTSPHLVHFGERTQVNRQLPSEAQVVALVERVREMLAEGARRGWWGAGDSATKEIGLGHPTFFEVVTIMGLLHFVEERCDVVIWETGLGGRLDATNLVTPLASVITNVALEHTQVLGDTVPKIAAEKSGIIKPGVQVITGATDPVALRVIREVAASRGAPCTVVPAGAAAAEVVTRNIAPGYQRNNAALTVTVVEALQSSLSVLAENLAVGLRQFSWPGRLQVIESARRRLLLDGAHNPAGLRALREALAARPDWPPCPVIFGTFADKDVVGVLTELAGLASRVLVVPVRSPRAADPARLARQLTELHPQLPVQVCASLGDALTITASEPRTLITGSLYLVGEALEHLRTGNDPGTTGEIALNDWRPTGTAPP